MIQAGMVAVHHNGKLARVIIPPSKDDPRVGVAFWLDTEMVMQMAWHMEWIADWWDDTVEEIQLKLSTTPG